MKYHIQVSVNVTPMPEKEDQSLWGSNSLYHSQAVDLEGQRFSDIAVTIDGLYTAIQEVVRAHGQR